MDRSAPDAEVVRHGLAALLAALEAAAPSLEEASAEADAKGHIAASTWTVLRAAGLVRAPLPVAEGGLGLAGPAGGPATSRFLRTLGALDLPLARLVEGHVNGVGLVGLYGSDLQRAELAAAVRDGALSGVWAADGAAPLQAERVDAGIRLRGAKVLASGAGAVSRPLVTAASPEGVLLLLLGPAEAGRADARMWTAQGMRATATGTVDLDGVSLPSGAVVGAPGDFLRQPHFSGGAWRFCAAHLGAAERLVDLFRETLVARGRQHDPYQLQRLAVAATAVGSAAFWVEAAARRLGQDGDPQDAVAFVNLTRGVTERAALTVLETVERGLGLSALVRPHPAERIARDLRTYLRQPVPDLAMADAARHVTASPLPVARLWGEV